MFLIAGLGNPGKQYEMTRHNIGFDVIDYISKEYNIKVNKIKHKAIIGEGIIQGERVILAKPQTFMNSSGESIREICDYYKLDAKDVIVIYDDIALAVGSLRIREKGSAGGHNGMKSIIYQLQSDEFMRLRIGVGAPKHEGYDLKDYVLGRYSKDEMQRIASTIRTCPDALVVMMKSGAQAAASKFNKTIKEEDNGSGK